MSEFSMRQRKLLEAEEEKNREFRAKSAPKMVGSIRSKDEVERSLQEYEEVRRYKGEILKRVSRSIFTVRNQFPTLVDA